MFTFVPFIQAVVWATCSCGKTILVGGTVAAAVRAEEGGAARDILGVVRAITTPCGEVANGLAIHTGLVMVLVPVLDDLLNSSMVKGVEFRGGDGEFRFRKLLLLLLSKRLDGEFAPLEDRLTLDSRSYDGYL